MKRISIYFAVLIMVMSCSKNLNNNYMFENMNKLESNNVIEKPNFASLDTFLLSKYLIYKPLTSHEKDSIKSVDSRKAKIGNNGVQVNVSGEGPEYADGSGYIHLKAFYVTSDYTSNLQILQVTVPDGYAMVGGGAWASGYSGNGAFLTESRPLNGNTWEGQSKAHIIPDLHQLTVFAIGMRITDVDPAYLRSNIYINSATSPTNSDFPTISVSVPENYLLIGGGAYDRWFGFGNLLVDSHPNGNEWVASGKAYRRSDPSKITAYAIGIQNISYPTVGYLQVSYNQTFTGSLAGEGDCNAPVFEGYALTCPGGYSTYHGFGRMLVGLYPVVNDAQVASKDTPMYGDFGTTSAYAVGIQKRPY